MRALLLLLGLLLVPVVAEAGDLEDGLRRIGSEEPAERLEGLAYLARCRGQPDRSRAVRALERALFDAQPAVRQGAVSVLVVLEARASGGEIVRLLGLERDTRVLPVALLALGRLEVQGAQPTLVRFASHPEAAVRACALAAAGDLGGEGMRRLVLNALQMAGEEDPGWAVRTSAMLALARIGEARDLEVVRRAYEGGGGRAHWMARSALAKVLAALHPQPRRFLEPMLADADARVAVTAAKGLADAGHPDVLLEHLADGRAGVRAAAVGGVRQANLRGATARLRRMARGDRSRAVRWSAAEVLFAWDDPLGDELVLDGLRSRESAIWTHALALLADKTGARHGRDVAAWQEELRSLRAR